jgi:hypothetical protein
MIEILGLVTAYVKKNITDAVLIVKISGFIPSDPKQSIAF